MKVALIDDEPGARAVARELLAEHFPQLRIAGEAGSVQEAQKLIESTRPELVFLDIDMPDGTGFDLLARWEKPPFEVIFITGLDQFAVRAFRCAAIDYFLKPLEPALFRQGVARFIEAFRLRNQPLPHPLFPGEQLTALRQNLDQKRPDRLLITNQAGFHVVLLADLLSIHSDGSYSTIFSKKLPKIFTSRAISSFDEMLFGCGFLRVHQSHLLNLNEVVGYDGGDQAEAILSDGQRIPVSRRKKAAFEEAIRQLAGWK